MKFADNLKGVLVVSDKRQIEIFKEIAFKFLLKQIMDTTIQSGSTEPVIDDKLFEFFNSQYCKITREEFVELIIPLMHNLFKLWKLNKDTLPKSRTRITEACIKIGENEWQRTIIEVEKTENDEPPFGWKRNPRDIF